MTQRAAGRFTGKFEKLGYLGGGRKTRLVIADKSAVGLCSSIGEDGSQIFLFSSFPPMNLKFRLLATVLSVAGVIGATSHAQTTDFRVTIENTGQTGGTWVTPVFAGLHDGTFDLFQGGQAASAGLELLAEVGMNGTVTSDFESGGFGQAQNTNGVLMPFDSASLLFQGVDLTATSQLTLATMLLPSNDWFLSNDITSGFDISGLSVGNPLTFTLDRLYDAGTEVNDFAFAPPPNQAFDPSLPVSMPPGGLDENGTVTFLGTIQSDGTLASSGSPIISDPTDPFGDFAGVPSGFSPGLSSLRITVTAVPEPSSLAVIGLMAGGAVLRRRRKS
ncbi:MAG: spondin domain-containing protein [Planctomycetota bacterium]